MQLGLFRCWLIMLLFGRCCSVRYEVNLGADKLSVTLHVSNPGKDAFDFKVHQNYRSRMMLYPSRDMLQFFGQPKQTVKLKVLYINMIHAVYQSDKRAVNLNRIYRRCYIPTFLWRKYLIPRLRVSKTLDTLTRYSGFVSPKGIYSDHHTSILFTGCSISLMSNCFWSARGHPSTPLLLMSCTCIHDVCYILMSSSWRSTRHSSTSDPRQCLRVRWTGAI